jgi:hypothetical protein
VAAGVRHGQGRGFADLVSRSRLPAAAVGVGVAVAAAYLIAGSVTLPVGGRHVRPLYDALVGPSTYAWVCPPHALKAGNISPNPAKLSITLTPAGSIPLSAATDDGQILFSLAQGEIAPHGNDTTVQATIVPLCASKLSPVPAGYSPAGNAYRWTLTYQPSGVAVTTTARPGNVVVRPPTTADALVYSADGGKTWQPLRPFHSGTSIGASFTEPGTYLALQKGTGNGLAAGSSGGSSTSPFLIALAVAVVAALIVGAVEFMRRRRRA